MRKMEKMEAAQVDTLTRKDLTDKCKAWAQGYPVNLFCGSDGKEVFTREDLRTSFTAGIEQYLRSIWHNPEKELPKEGEWCLLQTPSGFRLAVRRTTQTGVCRWWLMDYSMYDGKGLERWAYVADLTIKLDITAKDKI